MKNLWKRRRLWMACALVLMAGCGIGQTGRPADPAAAERALRAALDAWKQGEDPDTLSRRTPPILVSDVEWKGGLRLLRYTADEAGRLVGFDMNYPVVLELKSPRGKAVTKRALYAVTTQPEVLVVRQEDN
jgi:hypothetical protein